MARPRRYDEAGLWHHVSNHALDDVVAFETDADYRFFFSLIAREVRRGRLKVHAFVALSTHFHLLASSPSGELSRALQWIEAGLVQVYNRRRGRRGPLFNRRFWSKAVTTVAYRQTLVRYIDGNPVKAGLARASVDYPHGSARCYVTGASPPWLDREWVESQVCAIVGEYPYRPALYTRVFGPGLADVDDLVMQRARCGPAELDMLDEFVGGGIERLAAWLRETAAVDGRGVRCLPVASARGIERAIVARTVMLPTAGQRNEFARSPETIVRIALLRDLAGFSFEAIANHLGMPRTTVQDAHRAHECVLRRDPGYALELATIGHEAILAAISPSAGV